MGNVAAVGDATDFQTETIRSSFMKKVRLMQWSDKVHHSAARGTSFCSANGMNIIALALTFGRCSELNCVKACAQWLKKIPPDMAFAYDKGIRGMRSILPNLNFVFMPTFLAPSQGKTKLTVDEAIETRGTARCRYLIEITYSRSKAWHLLKEIIPHEHFHLMNSTWSWSLGFSNLAQKFLQPPTAVETVEQCTRRMERTRTEAAASSADMDELRGASAAVASAMDDAPSPVPSPVPSPPRRTRATAAAADATMRDAPSSPAAPATPEAPGSVERGPAESPDPSTPPRLRRRTTPDSIRRRRSPNRRRAPR